MINPLKGISVSVPILYVDVIVTFSILLSSNNQAFSSVENNNGKLTHLIKKVCPDYEGNGNLNGLVIDIFEACLQHGNSSEHPVNPNPETTIFPYNFQEFTGGFGADDGQIL